MEKQYVQKSLKNGKKTQDYELFTKALSEASQLTEKSKDEYYY